MPAPASQDSKNSSKGQKKKEDLTTHPCEVYHLTRPINKGEEKGALFAKHWLLYFDWGNRSITYDATNCDGILTYNSQEGLPDDFHENKGYKKSKVKENLKVTLTVVEEKACNNRLSGVAYNLSTANCQHWVKELAESLGFELPKDQVARFSDFIRRMRDGALSASTSVSAPPLTRKRKREAQESSEATQNKRNRN